MGNGYCFIMLQCLAMNVDNRYIHSGINILRVHLFFFSSLLILHFLSHKLQSTLPLAMPYTKWIYENIRVIFPFFPGLSRQIVTEPLIEWNHHTDLVPLSVPTCSSLGEI